MIIVKLQGGLGNQMFQYAAARVLSPQAEVYIDRTFIDNNAVSTNKLTARPYQLDIFKNVKAKPLNALMLNILYARNKFYRLLNKLLCFSLTIINENNAQVIYEKLSSIRQLLYLDGYFQNAKHLQKIRAQLLQEFQFPELKGEPALWLKQISTTNNAVCLHIRRGDYLKAININVHGVLPTTYYQQACNLINQKTVQPHYFVFSDDAEWCLKNLDFLSDSFSMVQTQGEAWVDMALMSQCKHHIIANSSFSWWGAWLSTAANKITIAPKQWFAAGGMNQTSAQIIPENWIRL